MSAVRIRDARDADADAACEVMRRSITELCTEDHRGQAKVLAAWLRNKQPDVFRGWRAQPGNSLMVATDGDDRILAVGSVTDRGEITLNYVLPDARFRGVSRALLAALERRAVERGNSECTLTSTATARRFYLARGYVETAPPIGTFGTRSGFPMRRALK